MRPVVFGMVTIVLAAVVWAAFRRPAAPKVPGTDVVGVEAGGLHIAPSAAAPGALRRWEEITEVDLLVRAARFRNRLGFALDLRWEDGSRSTLRGRTGPFEAFLAEAHHLAGFDHAGVVRALQAGRTTAVRCYLRGA